MDSLIGVAVNGVLAAIHPLPLALISLGVIIGIIVGALPGLSALTAMAVLTPITFGMVPTNAVFFFMGIIVGGQFGNSLPAVLIGTPGTPASIMSAVEGYEFQKRGEGGKALGLSLVSSTVGQLLSGIGFVLLVIPLADFSVQFLFPEIFALSVLGLTTAATLAGRNPVKGIVAAAFGIALTTIGPDPVTSRPRFSFGYLQLEVGLDIVSMIVGILVVSELIHAARQSFNWPAGQRATGRILPTLAELKKASGPMGLGTVIGFFIGALPGAGASVAHFVAYGQAKLFSRHPERFGKGSMEGFVAGDAANNASSGGELTPTLGLGIPGGPGMVLVLVVLLIHGITPGPGLLQSAPGVLEATVGGLLVGTVAMFVFGYLSIRPAVYLFSVSRPAVYVGALVISLIGIYSLRSSAFDVYVSLIAGTMGYFMRRYGYPVAPTALALILGGLIEENLRRGLVMTFGSFTVFFPRPVVVVILALSGVVLLQPAVTFYLRKRRRTTAPAAPHESIDVSADHGIRRKQR